MSEFKVSFTIDGYIVIDAEDAGKAEDKFWEKYDDDLDGLILHCDYADLYQDKPIRECATPF